MLVHGALDKPPGVIKLCLNGYMSLLELLPILPAQDLARDRKLEIAVLHYHCSLVPALIPLAHRMTAKLRRQQRRVVL